MSIPVSPSRTLLAAAPLALGVLFVSRTEAPAPPCDPDNGGLATAEGYCAAVVAEAVGAVRQITVGPNGDVYAAVSGTGGDGTGGVLAFRDTNGDGRPDERAGFGPGGGNDVELRDGFAYFALNDRIVRYRLGEEKLGAAGKAEVIVRDLPDQGGHVAKSIAFGGGDTMYVNVGSRTNSCQRMDRFDGSRGNDPCRELERRAGIWLFSATRPGQRFSDGRRFATGLRNAMALAVHPATGKLWAAVHGRDQLSENWGFSDTVNANNPAEELVQVNAGDDFGWPYCYYSNQHRKKVLAPEYGGDGRAVGRCASAKDPALAFPGHWAPMALAFTDAGAYLAFHGSWNRAPLPQDGYRVVFVPFSGGRPSGEYQTIAHDAEQRTGLHASGVAVAPDGSLYVSDDKQGKIWRITKGAAARARVSRG